MVIYSEKTKQRYDTVQECIAAETEYDREQSRIAEEKKKIQQEKEARQKELAEAHQAAVDAEENYRKLFASFVKDYGGDALGTETKVIPFDEAVLRLFGLPFDFKL